jgi:GNAT superfamily N-acetyltransferase
LKLAAPPNGEHRAEVAKLLVKRTARGRNISRQLMDVLESEALRQGRWLLMLDTQTDSLAETIYRRWGWQPVGIIEQHARTPLGVFAPTTLMVKYLHQVPS